MNKCRVSDECVCLYVCVCTCEPTYLRCSFRCMYVEVLQRDAFYGWPSIGINLITFVLLLELLY